MKSSPRFFALLFLLGLFVVLAWRGDSLLGQSGPDRSVSPRANLPSSLSQVR